MITRVGLHALRHDLFRATSLVVLSQFWASASTMLLFVFAARTMEPGDFGRYALHVACMTLVVALSDGGLGSMVVREIARTGSLDILRWNLKRRLFWVIVVAVPVTLIGTGGTSDVTILVVALSAWMNSWYSAMIGALFALDRVRRVIVIQFVNGLIFTGFGAWAYQAEAGALTFLAIVGSSYAILLSSFLDLLSQTAKTGGTAPRFCEQLPFMSAGAAYGIGGSVDSILLGRRSAPWVGEYAAAQKLAMGIVPISSTLGAVLLPRFTRRPARARTAMLLSTFVALLSSGALLGTLLLPVAQGLFGSRLADGALLALLFAVYAVDILLVPLSMHLLARGQEHGLAAAAWAQTIVATVCAWVLLDHGPAGVASALVIGRVVGLFLMVFVEVRAEDRGGLRNE